MEEQQLREALVKDSNKTLNELIAKHKVASEQKQPGNEYFQSNMKDEKVNQSTSSGLSDTVIEKIAEAVVTPTCNLTA